MTRRIRAAVVGGACVVFVVVWLAFVVWMISR